MVCDKRDQDILLLTHGELSPLRRAFTRAHLRRCSRCRQRKWQFDRTSMALSQAICSPDLPRWMPVEPPIRMQEIRTVSSWLRLASLIILILLLGLLLVQIALTLTHQAKCASAPSSVNAVNIGCIPGLPNDHCR